MTQTEKTQPTVIIIRETVAESVTMDAGTFLMALALIGIGALLDSTAMEWTGATIFWLTVVAVACRDQKKTKTPQEAADILKARFGVTAR
jgi:hypothetical protein